MCNRIGRALPVGQAALAAVMLFCTSARSQPDSTPPILNLYGSPGLLDMPGAHMAPDGAFTLWTADTGFTQRYGFSFQVTPWMEGAFRYIGTANLFNAQQDFASATYYDRSFGLRIRLQNETGGWPDIAMGIDDTIGTGIEAGEYFAASKHLGDFDATLGIGWGRLASTAMFENPFALVLNSFANRPPPNGNVVNSGGFLPFKQFFHGPNASLFGGFTWQSPIQGLSLIAEYSSDSYRIESEQHVFKPAIQVNVGASYQATKSLQLGAGFMYGKTAMFRASYTLDPTSDPFPQHLGAQPLAPRIRSNEELARLAKESRNGIPRSLERKGDVLIIGTGDASADCSHYAQVVAEAREQGLRAVILSTENDRGNTEQCATADAYKYKSRRVAQLASWKEEQNDGPSMERIRKHVIELAAKQALEIDAIALDGDQVDIAFTNAHYRTEPEAYGRLARILMDAMPDNVERFRIISLAGGMPTREIVLPRGSLERVIASDGGGSELIDLSPTRQTDVAPADISESPVSYPTFDWAILPEYAQSLFDPNQPYRYQLLAGLRGGMNFSEALRLEGELQASVLSDYSGLQKSNSQLPHVRSDALEYYLKGKNGIADLEGSYAMTITPGVYALARAGILESMFAGGGGEILWRPDAERWAVGATLYEVWQRGFDRLFDLRGYHVLTGHVSLYYESPWYGLDFRVDAGRYLAGDKGATFTVSRRFDTGVEVGLFATFTNVPFAQFGEGSFDKGFIIRIPMEFMAPLNSQSEFDMNLRPVSRDGGQMLAPEQVLYDELRRTSYGDYLAHADQIPQP